jgi:hypothetical protein
VRFPTEEVLACILERAKEPFRGLELPPMDAEEAWVLTEFLDEVQEAIWMEYGLAISDYLDGKGGLDCYHSSEDAEGEPASAAQLEDIDF